MKKLLTVLLTLAMAFTMVFATAASAEDGYKDSITWVIGNDQDILDPQNNVSNSKVIPQYYNGLLGFDNDGNVVCKIAESYEASEDKMVWTFHLRQDVYFHSGRHCTAHDFEATFDRLLNTENPQRYTSNASFIASAVATDDYTFVITLKEPKAFFLQAIAKQWAFVLNPEYIEKYGADLGKTAESVDGTGPFKCTQWDKGEVMKFEAFENYYEGAPLTHEIVMKIVPEQTSRAIAVETNQADIADGVSPDDAVRLDALDGVTVSKTDGNGCHLFQFNCASDHAPMSIPAVRQAISYAIDREAICEYLYSGLGEVPIDSIMAPSVAGYTSVGVVPYDPEKAKQLLAEAGGANGIAQAVGQPALAQIQDQRVGRGEKIVRRGGNPQPAQLFDIGRHAFGRVVGQKQIATAPLPDVPQQIQRAVKQVVVQVDGAVHVQQEQPFVINVMHWYPSHAAIIAQRGKNRKDKLHQRGCCSRDA